MFNLIQSGPISQPTLEAINEKPAIILANVNLKIVTSRKNGIAITALLFSNEVNDQ